MAVEARRGCGYRKVGGLYLVADSDGRRCGRFPIPCHVCPTCSSGIKPARGWTWINPQPLIAAAPCIVGKTMPAACVSCPMGPETVKQWQRVGLIWIGERFYPTPEHFHLEAAHMGISRRVHKIPRGFKVGETWVLFGHPKGCVVEGKDGQEKAPAIILAVRPARVELIATASQAADPEFTKAAEERGLTLVVVPDDDKDHRGTAYDAEGDE